jgi:YVTN family beta-propeller protein
MALTTDPRIGSVLAGYRIDELLGRGGMGVVYLAQDLSLERRVALKLLAPELSSEEGFRERFLRESRLAASIDHPNVIPIYEAGELDGTLFIAMRYVEGSDLKRLLEQEPLEPARALGLLEQVADGLDVAHEHGLVHRDVKPSNVLVAAQGGREHVYLADFGLSRRLAVAGAVERSHFSGSADYVAPEQVQRKPLDGRADLYALGCVLYECLTGRPPLQRDTVAATLFAHLEDDPAPASEENPALPTDLDPVLARALAKEPDERQSSCGELVEEAREALGIAAPRPGWRHLSRNTKLALALIALAVAAAAAVPALLLTGGGSAQAEAPSYDPTLAVTVDSLQRIDPKTNELVATFPAGDDPVGIATGEGSVWTASKLDGTATRIDPATGVPSEVISVGTPADLAIAGGFLWLLGADTSLRQIDPSTGALAQTVELLDIEAGPGHLAAGPDALWGSILCTCGSGLPEQEHGVVEIRLPPDGNIRTSLAAGAGFVDLDPAAIRNLLATGAIRKINVVDAAPTGIAVGEGGVWVANELGDFGYIQRYDPEAGVATEQIRVDGFAQGIAVGEGAVWVANPLDDTISRIDPATNAIVERIPVGDNPLQVAVGEGSVWVTNYRDGTVSRVDPATNKVVETIEVGRQPDHIAVGEGGVWVTVQAGRPEAD